MDEIIKIRGIKTVTGDRSESLAAFKQNPPKGGSPAKFRRRDATKAWCEGDILERINVVFGDVERLLVKIVKSGNTIKM